MEVNISTAREPFSVTIGGTVVEGVADYSDANLTEAHKLVMELQVTAKNVDREAKLDGRQNPTEDEAKRIAEKAAALITAIVGRGTYKDVLRAIGGGKSVPAHTVLTYLLQVWQPLAKEVERRAGELLTAKAEHYLSEENEAV